MTDMEPNKLSYNAELPEPVGETNTETLTVPTPEQSTGLQQPTSQNPQPVFQQPPQVATPINQAAATTVQPVLDTPLIADDADLIEKEWVLKAKAIVAQTAHDPNLQTKEMGKVKAEYLKKRYNKNLKLDES
jgi:hypothetical protein